MDKLKKEINEQINQYQKFKFAWFGRTVLCKMKIISKLNCILDAPNKDWRNIFERLAEIDK